MTAAEQVKQEQAERVAWWHDRAVEDEEKKAAMKLTLHASSGILRE